MFLPRVRIFSMRVMAGEAAGIALNIAAIFVPTPWVAVLLWLVGVLARNLAHHWSFHGGRRISVPLDIGHMVRIVQ